MSRKFKAAFIGCGKRAKSHVPGVKADARCEVVAMSDVNGQAAAALNSEARFDARLYADHREMLAKERPEVVIAALWTPLHLPVFKDCVAAGVKAVLSEKPMAPTWGDCLEMAQLAERSGTQLTFCHQRRFAKGNQLARKLIEEGTFGKITRMDLYSPPNLLDCGTHTFDQALSFNQETSAKWVLGAVDAEKPIKWFDVSAEAMAVGTIVFQNEVRAHFQVGGPDIGDMWGGVRACGTEGFIEVMWDGQFKRVVRYADPAWQPPAVEDHPDGHMVGIVKNALDCLEGGGEPETSHKKALRATEIIFALYESIRRHARVTLPLEGVTDNPFITMLEKGEFARGHK